MKSEKGAWCLAAFLLIIAIIVSFLFAPTVVSQEKEAEAPLEPVTVSTSTPEKAKVSENRPSAQSLPKVLLDIAWCESRDNQAKVGYNYRYREITLEDGSTTTEKYLWSKDIGRFQINDYYHAEEARRLGYDIYTVEGNTLYAILLYTNNGTRDWNPSKPCWSDIEAWRAKEKSYY